MFGRGFELFEVFGFKIRVDYSWFIIVVFITWTLAAASFPELTRQIGQMLELEVDEPSRATYWAMGILGALGLFASVLAHELSHALVARRYDIHMRGITLFIFGGVAEMAEEPPSPEAEFAVAVAGPIASLVISFLFFGVTVLGTPELIPLEATVVLAYLGLINVMLALFNLIPAFPLDGGRMLRSAIWYFKNDLRLATRVTTSIGSGFGIVLIVFGILMVFTGNIYAIWYALIGLFLRNAAQMSYQQLLLRRVLEGEPVARFMETSPVTVPRSISVAEFVESYVYRHHFKMFPVVDGDELIGCVTTRQIKELPREEWDRMSIGALAAECSSANSVGPDDDAMQALSLMSRGGLSRLVVVQDGHLSGILTLKDLLDFFSLKIELEKP